MPKPLWEFDLDMPREQLITELNELARRYYNRDGYLSKLCFIAARQLKGEPTECQHEDAHAAWRCTNCGAFIAECGPNLRTVEPARAVTVEDVCRASDLWIDGPSSLANALARNIRVLVSHIRAQKKPLRVPYPDFCMHPEKCAGKGSCPRNPSCCE